MLRWLSAWRTSASNHAIRQLCSSTTHSAEQKVWAEATKFYQSLTQSEEEFLRACTREYISSRGGGAGGQHKNRVKTGVRLTHTQLQSTVESSGERDGSKNLRQAVINLKLQLAVDFRHALPLRATPHTHNTQQHKQADSSEGAKEGEHEADTDAATDAEIQRIRGAVVQNQPHQATTNDNSKTLPVVVTSTSNPRFPAFVARLLDVLVYFNGQVKPTAQVFGLSTTALVRVMFSEKRLIAKVQSIRAENGLPKLSNPRQ